MTTTITIPTFATATERRDPGIDGWRSNVAPLASPMRAA